MSWVSRTDHKHIGGMYMLSALLFAMAGGVEAMAMRAQLAQPNLKLLTPQLYNQIFTMHGTTMIFLVVVPVLIGFGIYLVPLMIGANNLAFPRLTALGFWLQTSGGVLLYAGFATGAAPDAGWFSYPPLTEKSFSPGAGLDVWAVALLLLASSSVVSAINLVVTIATLRTPGMTMQRLPLFVWMMLIDSLMIVFSQPVLAASLVMLLGDRLLHAIFFDASRGGAPLLWQHYFWIFGHPEVYIMILPAFGMISEVIPVFSRKPIFGYPLVAASSVAIAFLSYGVWAHHMFAVPLGRNFLAVFAASSMLIAVPTGVKIFNWTATMWGGSIRFTTSMLFAVAFLLEFTIGGLSGVAFAAIPIDWQLTDSYFVVAHIHYVLFGGTIFAIFAAIYYWFPKMTGHLLNETMGRWHFWLVVIGFNATFFVQHLLGLLGMPRRVYTYPDLPGLGSLNLTSTLGAGVLTFGILVFCCNLLVSLQFGGTAGDNPWNAWTLEWATTSPPAHKNFDYVPPVRSRRPLWDLSHPESPDWLAAPQPLGGRRMTRPMTQDPAKLGMALFLTSESVFFLMLILAFIIFRGVSLREAAETLSLPWASFCTACSLGSGFAMWQADRVASRPAGGSPRLSLMGAMLLGALFLLGQESEYLRLANRGVTIGQSLFGTTFFTLTGIHGLHVLIGILWVGLMLSTPMPDVAVSMVAAFWLFISGVWIVIFSVVFLWTFL
jgi:cytochrome c oxidase subunit I